MKANELTLDKMAWFFVKKGNAIAPIGSKFNNKEANYFLLNGNGANKIKVTFRVYNDEKTIQKQLNAFERKLGKIIKKTGYLIESHSNKGVVFYYSLRYFTPKKIV